MDVLVLESGNSSAYHVMRSLALAGHVVHISSPDEPIWQHSRYCARVHRSPPVDRSAEFAAYLIDLVQSHAFDLLLFCGDDEAEIVAAHREGLEPWVTCLLPDAAGAAVAFSKNDGYRHAAEIGVPIPRTEFPTGESDLRRVVGLVGTPAIVKGSRGSSASRVRFAASFDALVRAYREIASIEAREGGRPSIQEYIDGPGFVVHAVFDRGTPVALCSHRKDREYPVGGGVTARATTIHDSRLDEAALRFLSSLRWHGPAKLDFKFDADDGAFKFLEVDARISASIDMTRVAGTDQTLVLSELATGQTVLPRLSYQAGVRYRWLYPRDILAVLGRPQQLPAFALEFFASNDNVDLSLRRDPGLALPVARMVLRYIRREFRRRRHATPC